MSPESLPSPTKDADDEAEESDGDEDASNRFEPRGFRTRTDGASGHAEIKAEEQEHDERDDRQQSPSARPDLRRAAYGIGGRSPAAIADDCLVCDLCSALPAFHRKNSSLTRMNAAPLQRRRRSEDGWCSDSGRPTIGLWSSSIVRPLPSILRQPSSGRGSFRRSEYGLECCHQGEHDPERAHDCRPCWQIDFQ
jgi:hypothetical protein